MCVENMFAVHLDIVKSGNHQYESQFKLNIFKKLKVIFLALLWHVKVLYLYRYGNNPVRPFGKVLNATRHTLDSTISQNKMRRAVIQ